MTRDYEWYVSEYEARYHTLLEHATIHPDWPEWSKFYWYARKWAIQTIAELGWDHPYALRNFTACIAALSPLKPWAMNQHIAVLALNEYMERGTCQTIPAMDSRKRAAERALTTGVVSGRKVEPFARALYGDNRAAVIDRHMLDACRGVGGNDDTPQTHVPHLIEALTRVTDHWRSERFLKYHENVTQVQAGLWGFVRYEKGLPTIKEVK